MNNLDIQTTEDIDISKIKDGDEILILVHPGSACGSAGYNIGKRAAENFRDLIIDDLNCASGHVIVLGGVLDNEIAEYDEFHEAITDAVEYAQREGLVGTYIEACDPDQVQIVERLMERLGDLGKQVKFELTGAWVEYTDEGYGQCVGSVYDAIKKSQASAHVEVLQSSVDSNYDDSPKTRNRP